MNHESSPQLLMVWAAFFVGVAVADGFVVRGQFYVVLGLVAVLCGVAWWRARRAGTAGRHFAPAAPALGSWWLATAFAIVLLLSGVGRMEYAERQFMDTALIGQAGDEVQLIGQVVREPDVRENFAQLYVEVDDELLLVRTDRFTAVTYGDTVTVEGDLERPESFLTDTNRVFDYPGYLRARGVQYVVGFAQVEVTEVGGGNPVVAWLYELKGEFAAAVTGSLPPPEGDLGLGLLLGIKQALGDDLETAFRQTGLIHIVVLSGYNVMLVIGFFWWLSSWVLPLRGRVVFGLIGITLFAILVGLSATVARASIMAGILLLARYIGTRYDVLRALLLAALVMVVLNPYLLLYDLGFQLSFMATLGLVLFLPQFESTVVTDRQSLGLRDIFLATTVTQVFVLPLLMFHIGEVSVVSVLVNMLVLPIVAMAMALTFVTGLIALFFQTLAWPVAFLALVVLSYIITVVEWFATWPLAAVLVPPISVGMVLLLYGLIAAAWYAWHSRRQADLVTDTLTGWTIVDLSDHTTENSAPVTLSSSIPSLLR